MSVQVGKDVEAACRKCGEVWHVIVTMDAAGVITKVQCKQCGGNHRYKPPEGEERIDAKAKAKKSPAKKTTKRKTAKRKTSKLAPGELPPEPLVEPNLTRPVRDYSLKDVYALGDRVDHPKFGHGVVEKLSGPGKVSVFFEDGRKTLAHAR
jgi:transcription elongation factor Elf1